MKLKLKPDTGTLEEDKDPKDTLKPASIVELHQESDNISPQCKDGDTSDFEQTLNTTPELQSNKKDLVIVEREDANVFTGAETVRKKFCWQLNSWWRMSRYKIVSKKMVGGKLCQCPYLSIR